MNSGLDKAKLAHYKARFAKAFGDPLRMRLAVVFTVTAAGIGAVYMPLSDRIGQQRAQMAAEQQRFETIKDVEALRREVEAFRPRISDKSDTNDWVQYLLGGLRQAQVRLRNMETKDPRRVGPYKAVSLVVEVEGTYPELRTFIEWLEQSDRLLRVETVRLEKMPGVILMKAQVLGLVRNHAEQTG